jgi:Rrf2 family protein
MSNIVQLSEASSLGIHAMVIIARTNKIMNATTIAEMTGASRNHLAKVMLMLVKRGFVKSLRGPTGGFILAKKPDEITLLDIYETIEGRLNIPACAANNTICPFDKCIVSNLIQKVTEEIKTYFGERTLKDYI